MQMSSALRKALRQLIRKNCPRISLSSSTERYQLLKFLLLIKGKGNLPFCVLFKEEFKEKMMFFSTANLSKRRNWIPGTILQLMRIQISRRAYLRFPVSWGCDSFFYHSCFFIFQTFLFQELPVPPWPPPRPWKRPLIQTLKSLTQRWKVPCFLLMIVD